MLRTLWTASVHVHGFLRRWMPTNVLLDLIRTRRGLKWGVPAMLVAVPYLVVASTCAGLLQDGGPGWLNLVVLLCVWNALKFIAMGPVSAVALARTRWHEASVRRQEQDLMRGRNVGAQLSRVSPISAEPTRSVR